MIGCGLFVVDDPVPRWRVSTARPVTYDVCFASGLLDHDNATLVNAGVSSAADSGRRLVVVDAQVMALFGDRISGYFNAWNVDCQLRIVASHETSKTMEAVFRIVGYMDAFGISRRSEPLIVFGGGVLMDIVGLAASLYRRSTPYVRVPTTLIGLIDAGIGAKTGVNFGHHKNRLGSYHPSSVTLLDQQFLATLDERHVSNGLAEVLKIALIKDPVLFELLADNCKALVSGRLQDERDDRVSLRVLCHAVQGMLEELQPNLWEHQLQRLVDYGHSFSPTIEMDALPELLHGEAVTVDMAFTTVLARRRGLVSDAECDRILGLMADLGLPTWHPACTDEAMLRALADTVRHRDGRQSLPLPVGIGSACFVDDVTAVEIRGALAEISGRQQPTGVSQ